MNTRPITVEDIAAMIAATQRFQVGDYIQPLVGEERGRRTLRVTARRESSTPLGPSVRYTAVDRFGAEFDVWGMDSPRASNEQEFTAEEPMP